MGEVGRGEKGRETNTLAATLGLVAVSGFFRPSGPLPLRLAGNRLPSSARAAARSAPSRFASSELDAEEMLVGVLARNILREQLP